MIATEQHIILNIFHRQKFEPYVIIQSWKEDFGVTFKVFKKGMYYFSLVITNKAKRFELSEFDRELNTEIDWPLYSKIEASIYSVYLRDLPS